MNITRVWVEEGCICCEACVHALPSVFAFPYDRAVVLGVVREDGLTSPNETELSALNTQGIALAGEIREAASVCPVEVIQVR